MALFLKIKKPPTGTRGGFQNGLLLLIAMFLFRDTI
jgi:hypothetical protein